MKFDSQMLQVYLVGGTQDTHNDSAEFLLKLKKAMQAGITAFQYREKGSSTLTPNERQVMARKIVEMGKDYSVPILIDDDVQLALDVKAAGVHVGQKDQRIEQVISHAGDKLIIGYSCNTPEEIMKANQLTAVDYIGCGPIFETSSKADADPALGLRKLRELNKMSCHPLVAIGGLNKNNLRPILNTGVSGLSMISMILGSSDITETVTTIKGLY